MPSSNCCFLTCMQVSQEAGQVVLYSHLFQNFPQFIVIHTVKGFGIDSKAEIDVFLELSCFFHDPADVGNLISGSSAFSKTSLNIWKFMVHILLKSGLETFEHFFTSMWDVCNCAVAGFPGNSEVKASVCNAGDLGLIPGSGRFPWRRKWQPTPVFLPSESHGWRKLVGYRPRVTKSRTRLSDFTFTFLTCYFFMFVYIDHLPLLFDDIPSSLYFLKFCKYFRYWYILMDKTLRNEKKKIIWDW